MMKYCIVNWFLFFIIHSEIYAQDRNILDSVFSEKSTAKEDTIHNEEEEKHDFLNDSLVHFQTIRENDVMWSKKVWELIDLKEEINLHLHIDTTNNTSSNKKTLFYSLMEGIKQDKITQIYADPGFTQKITKKEVLENLIKIDTLDMGYEAYNAGEDIPSEFIIREEIDSKDISQYHIFGMWYFDKHYSELRYRLLGIAPVSRDINFLDDETQPPVELFWIWYRDARKVLYDSKLNDWSKNYKNISYDLVLLSRFFQSTIYQEDNIYNNRSIKEYIHDNIPFRILESQRIKDRIRNREEDFWTY